jgi:hypothetical protein
VTVANLLALLKYLIEITTIDNLKIGKKTSEKDFHTKNDHSIGKKKESSS